MDSGKLSSSFKLILFLMLSGALAACKKQARKPSEKYIPPIYPEEFNSIPCYATFSQPGSYLFKKRMTLEARSGSISSWPFFATYDSTDVRIYKTSSGLTAISFTNLYSRSDSLNFYFKYIDFTKKLKYQLINETNVTSPKAMELNQCFALGSGVFTGINFNINYPLDIFISRGEVYLGVDAATGKRELALCDCSGTIIDIIRQNGAIYTGRFTLNN